MRFLVIGSLNVDMLFLVPHIVRAGETIQSGGLKLSAGGKGANQAASMGKAGLPVSFAGKIGNDGIWILELLKGYGVDVSQTVVSMDVHTGQAIIQIDEEGQNSIILNPGGNMEFTIEEISFIMSSFEEGDVLVLQNEINLIPEIILKAKDKGMRIVFNPSPFDDGILDYPLDGIDLFFVNEIEGAALAQTAVPHDEAGYEAVLGILSEKYPKAGIVLTAGKRGAYFKDPSGSCYAPIVDFPVVDTTGAGDTFCGYFLAGIYMGRSPQKSLELASLASAYAVSRPGAMQSMPTISEVAK